MERIGLIAGSGRFPVLFAETARRRGAEVVAVAHRGETAPELERVVAAVTWVHPGELGAVIDALKRAGVRRAVMVGGIAKPRLFKELRFDERALAVIARVGRMRDDLVLRAVADELQSEGITVVASTCYLDAIVPEAGVLGARAPSDEEWEDIRFGFRAAKVIGQFDIGQSVVVRSGAVLAVEGIEGTDATIRRAGELGNGDVTVVKVCKPTQDTRFDLPAVGPETIRTLAAVRGRALAVEARRTVTLDRAEMIALADAAGIAVVAVDGPEERR
ncbi:MAG TPA: UDP-2,3-diacylglucosamine diphosphatase LpxI [Candidatus Binatia bacterium]|nr:UDP-2,3-diacylglucosamine diphosphatase LpxI [Candidatus Binatia bacterium]